MTFFFDLSEISKFSTISVVVNYLHVNYFISFVKAPNHLERKLNLIKNHDNDFKNHNMFFKKYNVILYKTK